MFWIRPLSMYWILCLLLRPHDRPVLHPGSNKTEGFILLQDSSFWRKPIFVLWPSTSPNFSLWDTSGALWVKHLKIYSNTTNDTIHYINYTTKLNLIVYLYTNEHMTECCAKWSVQHLGSSKGGFIGKFTTNANNYILINTFGNRWFNKNVTGCRYRWM